MSATMGRGAKGSLLAKVKVIHHVNKINALSVLNAKTQTSPLEFSPKKIGRKRGGGAVQKLRHGRFYCGKVR